MLAMLILAIIFLVPIISKDDHYYSLLTYCFVYRIKESLFCLVIVFFMALVFVATFMMLILLYGRPEKKIMFTTIGLVAMSHLLFFISVLAILTGF